MDSKQDQEHIERLADMKDGSIFKGPAHDEKSLSTTTNANMFDAEQTREIKRIMRLVDLRLVGILAILYAWAFIDRANLANASIAGMSSDLHLNISSRYSIVTMIFFVGYIVIDIPTNWIVSKTGATLWIPTIVTLWGVITIGQGFVHSWESLLACRILLGLCEGGLIPSAIFLIGEWYTRYEAHARLAAFYVVGISATGFSGLLAYGIEKLDGTAGLEGWRWIFIIEGICTAGCGLLAYVVLLELPERSTLRTPLKLPAFLTEEQSVLIQARLANDHGTEEAETLDWKSMLSAAKDWKVWEFASYVMLNNTALYAFSYFLPQILKQGLGYSTSKAQLYTFPPYAVAAVWIMAVAFMCDKLHIRGPFMIFNSVLYIVGMSLIAFHHNPNVRYGAVFLGVVGIAGNVPSNFAYAHNNIRGRAKRAVCAALMTIGGAFGGIIAGNIFQAQDAPTYRPGVIVCIAFQAVSVLLLVKNFVVFSMWNRRTGGEMEDTGKGFRYTY